MPDYRPPSEEALRVAMEAAWRDHHHARDQTWRSLHIEALLAAGLLTVDAQFHQPWATFAAGLVVALSAVCGVMITRNHRKLERRKFVHIMNCEELLGLHRDDVIPLSDRGLAEFGLDPSVYKSRCSRRIDPEVLGDSAVSLPRLPRCLHLFDLRVNNTAMFILRMHFAILAFVVALVTVRFIVGSR